MIAAATALLERDDSITPPTAALVALPLIEKLGDAKQTAAAAAALFAMADIASPAFVLEQLTAYASADRGPKLLAGVFVCVCVCVCVTNVFSLSLRHTPARAQPRGACRAQPTFATHATLASLATTLRSATTSSP